MAGDFHPPNVVMQNVPTCMQSLSRVQQGFWNASSSICITVTSTASPYISSVSACATAVPSSPIVLVKPNRAGQAMSGPMTRTYVGLVVWTSPELP